MNSLLKRLSGFGKSSRKGAAGLPASLSADERNALSELTPWMAYYREVVGIWLYQPFVMFGYRPNFRSDLINFDRFGLRHTIGQDEHLVTLDTVGNERCNLLVGGSVTLGFGATNDRYTIPSVLSQSQGRNWLNLGIGGYVLQQSLVQITFLERFMGDVDQIVIFSGINDLASYLLSDLYSPVFGSIFSESVFLRHMNKEFQEIHGPDAECDGVTFVKMTDHEKQRDILAQCVSGALRGWARMALSLDAELSFVMQPFPAWMSREPVEKEQRLFAQLDKTFGDGMPEIIKPMTKMGPWFCNFVKEECGKIAIPYYDLNEDMDAPEYRDRWLFVDRGHLTDEGHAVAAQLISQFLASKPGTSIDTMRRADV